MGAFSNPLVGGAATLIRAAIRSANYVAGLTGWSINRDGSADFNDVAIRGSLTIDTADGEIRGNSTEGLVVAGDNGAAVYLQTLNASLGAYLAALPPTVPGFTYQPGLVYATTFAGQDDVPVIVVQSPYFTAPTVRDFARIYVLGEDGAGNPPMIDLRASGPVRVLDGDLKLSHDLSIGGRGQGRGLVYAGSFTSDSAAVGAETVVLVLFNITLVDGRAYRVRWGPNIETSAGPGRATIRVRQPDAAGQLLHITFAEPETAGNPVQHLGECYVSNTTGADITTDVALTMAAAAGTVTHVGTATAPRYLLVEDIGLAADWTNCVAVV